MKEKKETIKSRRENPLYTPALIPHGNGKLLDYTDENGVSFRYAQVNTRALLDCPFATEGCKAVCYATKGNHQFSDVKESRIKSYNETKRDDFPKAMLYTIETEKRTKRYSNSVMIIRIHESGDFYSLQYMKKWVKIWAGLEHDDTTKSVLYTKCFKFLLMLNEEERALINRMLESRKLSINLSLDDTTTEQQLQAYLEVKKLYPKTNTYYATEHVENVEHDNVCDCADCAKCGTCNKGTGKTTVVKIHSASRSDMETYRANIK